MHNAILLLGSNLGNKKEKIESALFELSKRAGKINLCSGLYKTSAWGIKEQPDFINQVVNLLTEMTPLELLNEINTIENKLGRLDRAKWHSREIDIDILFYDNEIIDNETLIIPHPQMTMRKFTMVPLAEILPDFIHPIFKKSIACLLDECKDNEKVELITEH